MTGRIWKGNPKLEPFLVEVSVLSLNPDNTRRHTRRDVLATAKSLETHGQQEPIVVDGDLVTRAGNGRLLAAKHLGWTHIAALPSDIADPDQMKLYAIADNRTAELSSWELESLSKQLQELSDKFNLTDMALWEDYELGPLLDADWTPPESKHDDSTGEDRDGGPDMGAPLVLTSDQRLTIDRAIEKVREMEEEPEMKDGRAIELICGDFLS